MSRSIIVAALTAYTFWTLGAFLDYALKISSLPIAAIGLLLAALILRSGLRPGRSEPATTSEAGRMHEDSGLE